MNLILASKSPRRAELFRKIAPEFSIVPSSVNEDEIQEKDPLRLALAAAAAKAKAVAEANPSAVVLGADTVVALGDAILGKPRSYAEAKRMLETLSGTRHRVITGLALYRREDNRLMTEAEITTVVFNRLSPEQIEQYLARDEYADKAGAYGIQSVGDVFVREIRGDYDNVVGFPVKRVRRMLAAFTAPEYTVEVTDIALPNDWAVGRTDGLIVFVPGAVPGDTARIRIVKQEARFAHGELLSLVKESPFRAVPECPHFGSCGGCILQHLAYEKQLGLKRNYLVQTLRKIGDLPPEQTESVWVTPSPDIYFYRNKMEYVFGEENGRVVLGLRERASPVHRKNLATVPLKTCKIFSPVVDRIFPVFLAFAAEKKLTAYNHFTNRGFLRNLVLREGKNTGQLMVLLVTGPGEIQDFTRLGEELLKAVPETASFFWVINDRPADVVSFGQKNHLLGTTSIEDRIGNLKLKIGPQTFFQPNTRGAELLYATVAEFAGRPRKIVGLYCGSGAIELSLAGSAERIIGIDSSPANIAAAQDNCRNNRIENCTFVEGEVEKVLKTLPEENVELFIVDPPRAGISPKALNKIVSFGPPRMIYVSCNPASLARDLKLLREQGYGMEKIAAFDLFPHTGHLETVVALRRQ